MKSQRGIALIQVLLISGIIGLLMLQIGLTAREQVARAEALAQRADLQLKAQSHESAIVFSMLTQPLIARPESANPYAAAWNFMGRPFVVNDVTFRLQDESGRLRVPLYGSEDFERLLVAIGVEAGRARRLGQQLLSLQGTAPRLRALGEDAGMAGSSPSAPQPLQVLQELRLLPDMDEELYLRVKPLLTLYPTPGLNPLTAPGELLTPRMSESQLAGVLEARQSGELDQLAYWRLTGIEADERSSFATGPAVTVELELEGMDARVQRTTTFIVRPYTVVPLAVWQRTAESDRNSR